MNQAHQNSIERARRERIHRIENWLKHHKGRNNALSLSDARRVAARVVELLKDVKRDTGQTRGRVASKAFQMAKHEANSKLRHYTSAQNPVRKPAPYLLLLTAIADSKGCDTTDLLLQVFRGTEADAPSRPWGPLHAMESNFERLLDNLARRISERTRLAEYYGLLATYGLIRDLTAHDVAFARDEGADMASPQMDLAKAGIPITEAMGEDLQEARLDLPWIFQGRLPMTTLYRIRVAPPVPVDLRLRGESVGPGGDMREVESRRAEIVYYWEVRFGVAPKHNALESGMCFEFAPVAVIKPSNHDDAELRPALAYELPSTGWPDAEITLSRGTATLSGDVLDPSSGKRYVDKNLALSDMLDLDWPLDPDAAAYIAATPESCRTYLVDWPYQHGERIEYVGIRPTVATPLRRFFPPDTIGETLERQLWQEDGSSGSVEVQLCNAAERLHQAVGKVRRESQQAGQKAQISPIAADDTEWTEAYLGLHPRGWRQALDISQKEAARLLQLNQRTISDYERGARELPHTVRLAMLFCRFHPEIARTLAGSAHQKGTIIRSDGSKHT